LNVKIISINIEAANLLDQLLEFVREQTPDILLMQEVFISHESLDRRFHILEHLQDILRNYYLDRAATYDTYRGGTMVEAGNAILSRFPIVESQTFFYSIPYTSNYVEPTNDYSTVPRNLEYIQVDLGVKKLNVFNTHGVWGFDGLDNDDRLYMSRIIVKQIKRLPHVVLGGDFNVGPNTQTIKNIEKHLVNIFKSDVRSTFNMKRKSNPVYANLVVDMMFVSKDLTIIRKGCPQVDISDHLPLVVEIII
jgi:endonuclease/exonuclease/phosphatase family metal-dependent hydrolase